ncbi:transposase, partial [Enterococcus faecium]
SRTEKSGRKTEKELALFAKKSCKHQPL